MVGAWKELRTKTGSHRGSRICEAIRLPQMSRRGDQPATTRGVAICFYDDTCQQIRRVMAAVPRSPISASSSSCGIVHPRDADGGADGVGFRLLCRANNRTSRCPSARQACQIAGRSRSLSTFS